LSVGKGLGSGVGLNIISVGSGVGSESS